MHRRAKSRSRSLMAQALKVASRAAQIASTPASSLRAFPPKEAIFNAAHNVQFSPDVWANLQKPPSSALSAFVHRIGLHSVIKNEDDILQACTHPTYPPFYSAHNPNEPAVRSNANLTTLGNSLMGLFATEYLHAAYPHLPTRVLKAAVSVYVGPVTCASVAREMGAVPLLRWNQPVRISRFSSTFKKKKEQARSMITNSMRFLLGTYFLTTSSSIFN